MKQIICKGCKKDMTKDVLESHKVLNKLGISTPTFPLHCHDCFSKQINRN